MKRYFELCRKASFCVPAFICISCASFGSSGPSPENPKIIGWYTNGPAVFYGTIILQTTISSTDPIPYTNKVFHHYLPGSLPNLVWTNLLAHTNGKSMTIWSTRSHSIGWPNSPPEVTWNPQSLIFGMKGFTALSPCWQVESGVGQVPVTALTRRHAYARGHGMGPDGFNKNVAGKKIWFVTADNTVIEATVLRNVVRTYTEAMPRDYTIMLLSKDLPIGIEPMRVVNFDDLYARYPEAPANRRPILKTEQTGQVSADIPGFTCNTWKGGDSGSPDMLPIPGELIFVHGRSTSGGSVAMQADMDELCRQERLDPRKYQLQWLDLSRFPSYPRP